MECTCDKCGMGVKGLTCTKCDSKLVQDTITTDDNKSVKVAKCPEGCGKILTPQCCGQDMSCAAS